MKIFIAGASGVLGRRLVRSLMARGHSVVGQVRSAKAEAAVAAAGGEPRQADLFDSESLARAADGCEVVIHAATAIPTKQKTTAADWAMNDHIRRKGTRCLAEAAGKIGAKAYIQQSVVWVANPKDGSTFDEDSPVVADSLVRSAVDAEAIAREAGAAEGFTTAILRGGAFYDCDSAHTRMLADGIRKRAMPIIGRGDAVWSLIHTDDAASAYAAVAERPRAGVWHIVDDEPVAVSALFEAIAARLGAPRPRHVPVWLARWFAGERAVAYFTRSTRTSNARFRRDFGWAPKYPTYREGLDQTIAEWKKG